MGSDRPTGKVTDAVILMAGSGSRLRGLDDNLLKPLVPLFGRALISYTLDALTRAGISRIHVVVGYKSEELSMAITNLAAPELEVHFVKNSNWQKQNGISLLAAAQSVTGPFLLTMSDHFFDQVVIDTLIARAVLAELNVAVDRKIDAIFDLDDAMKVRLCNDRVVEIGKNLKDFNAIDTGLFVCPVEIFSYLEKAKENGDVSLADGVRAMAQEGKVRGIDIGDGRWQDIDTPEMLRHAEQMMRTVQTFA